jgi:hypothetical protein
MTFGDSAAYAQIAARARLRGAAAHRLPGLQCHRGPQRQTRAEVRTGERHHRAGLEFESRAHQSHFHAGGILRIAYQEIAGA